MPAGVAHAPGGVPLESLILEFRLREPKGKVVSVALVLVRLNALADADGKVLLLEVVENVIAFELRGIEIYVASGSVGVIRIDELVYHLDVLGNAVRRGLDNVRALYIELFAVSEKGVCIVFRYIHNALVLALCALEHLVLAGVPVRGEVADVGYIHNALYVVAEEAEVLFQHVLHDIAPQISDMCKVVHRRAAGVHLHDIGVVGLKLVLSAGR